MFRYTVCVEEAYLVACLLGGITAATAECYGKNSLLQDVAVKWRERRSSWKHGTFQVQPCRPLMCSQPKKKSSVFLKSEQIAHFALFFFFLPEQFSVSVQGHLVMLIG